MLMYEFLVSIVDTDGLVKMVQYNEFLVSIVGTDGLLLKAPVTLSRPDSRPFPTLMVGRGLVKS